MSVLLASAVCPHMERAYPDEISAGDSNLLVTVFNHGTAKLKNAKASLYIPDFDARDYSETFSLKSRENRRLYFFVDMPDKVKQEYHPAIITLNADRHRHRSHTWVYATN